VVEPDLRGYFDRVDPEWLQKLTHQGISFRWLSEQSRNFLKGSPYGGGAKFGNGRFALLRENAGVFHENVYLLAMFLLWAERWCRNHGCGDLITIRLAENFVLGFKEEAEALGFQEKVREGFRRKLH
jgi:hypothetical protein